MTVGNPFFLLLLILIPFLVLFYRFVEGERMHIVSSLLFWTLKTHRESASPERKRPPFDLILLLRILFICSCAFALSDIRLPSYLAGKEETIILVMDTSASMKAKYGNNSRFEKAREQARHIVSAHSGAAKFRIISTTDVQGSAGFTDMAKDMCFRTLSSLSATDEPGFLVLAVTKALETPQQEGRVEIFLVSDGGFGEEEREFIEPLVKRKVLHFISAGEPVDNVGIVRFVPREHVQRQGTWDVLMRLANSGASRAEFGLVLHKEGSAFERIFVSLDPSEVRDYVFTVHGAGTVEARLELEDGLESDNSAYAVLPGGCTKDVLLVSPGNRYLEQALSLDPLVRLSVRTPEEAAVFGTAGYDLVVLDRTDSAALPDRGRIMLVDSFPPGIEAKRERRVSDPEITSIDPEHPITEGLLLNGVSIFRASPAPAFAGSRALIRYGDKLLAQTVPSDSGEILVLHFDVLESTFPLSPDFPRFIERVLSWYFPENRKASRTQVLTGSEYRFASVRDSVFVETPGGMRIPGEPICGEYRIGSLIEAGLYLVKNGPQPYNVAVNLCNSKETDTRNIFFADGEAGAGNRNRTAGRLDKPTNSFSLWPVFSLCATVFLLAEAVLHGARRTEKKSATRARFLVFRGLSLCALVGALVLYFIPSISRYGTIFFVMDVSESVSPFARASFERFVETVLERKHPEEKAGLLLFGRDVSVENAPRTGFFRPTYTSVVDKSGTDIEKALSRAASLMPEGGSKCIILLSDGNETAGNARRGAAALGAMGIRTLCVIPDPAGGTGEALIKDILIAEPVRASEPHRIAVMVESSVRSRAVISLSVDDAFAGEDEVLLYPGLTTFGYVGEFSKGGIHRYSAELRTEDDTIPENNRFSKLVTVEDEPSILYVSGPGSASESFLKALTVQGIHIQRATPETMPKTLSGLLRFESLIFDDVHAGEFSLETMRIVERYVRDAGGGFLMIGGGDSFGAGGYYKTPVEAVLPVYMDDSTQADMPGVSIVAVVDKSGSMAGKLSDDRQKIDLVKSAVRSTMETLHTEYSFGILAFDLKPVWIRKLAKMQRTDGSAPELDTRLENMESSGDSHLYEALQEARRSLSGDRNAVKHIIVLSDGVVTDADFAGLCKELRDQGITVTTMAVGADADLGLMREIADSCGGRAYFTADFKEIPQFFSSELQVVTQRLITEEMFFPVIASDGGVLSGIVQDDIPPLFGFVTTYPKQDARQVLSAAGGKPLLAVWEYGLGRAAAFTSDVQGRWSKQWLTWKRLPKVFSQLVRWIGKSESGRYLIHSSIENGTVSMSLDALGESGEFLNGLDPVAVISGKERKLLHLTQSQPGRYEAGFGISVGETTYVSLSLHAAQYTTDRTVKTFGIEVPYSSEFEKAKPDYDLLGDIASLASGKAGTVRDESLLHEALRSELNASFQDSGSEEQPFLRTWLLLASLMVFCLELAVSMICGRSMPGSDGRNKRMQKKRLRISIR